MKNFIANLRETTFNWYVKYRHTLTVFFEVTPCKECLRGRLWFMFGLGGFISGSWFVFVLGMFVSFIYLGRKKNWWLDKFDS